jgi:hypothetical protein
MRLSGQRFRVATLLYPLAAVLLNPFDGGATVRADVVTWVQWTEDYSGAPSVGTMSFPSQTVNVTFQTPNTHYSFAYYDAWGHVNHQPFETTYYDGSIVSNPPPWGNIELHGNGVVNTINFSSPLVNPTMSFLSVGDFQLHQSYSFDTSPTFVSGGPSWQFAGQAINVSGNVVDGYEGNGTVVFYGVYSSLTWINSQPGTTDEPYIFTVGAMGLATGVPEPSSLALVATAVTAAACCRRRLTSFANSTNATWTNHYRLSKSSASRVPC